MLLMVDLTGLASEAGHKIGGPRKHAEVSLYVCNNACNSAERRASGADSPGEQGIHSAQRPTRIKLGSSSHSWVPGRWR